MPNLQSNQRDRARAHEHAPHAGHAQMRSAMNEIDETMVNKKKKR